MVGVDRHEIVASALGSTRAEGLEPDEETVAVLEAWARGEVSDADLDLATTRAVNGQPIGLATA